MKLRLDSRWYGESGPGTPTFPSSITSMRGPERSGARRNKLQPPRNRQRGINLKIALNLLI